MDTEQDIIGQVMGLDLAEAEVEEEEEPPSLDNQLESFRQQWREELYLRRRSDSAQSGTDRATLEEQAKQIFMTGSKLEQEGSLLQAIQFYRHAMRLVPDIENLIRIDFITHSPRERQISESSIDSFDGEVLDEETDLIARFHDLHTEKQGWCCPEFQQRACHISALPTEVMIYILKWVISTQLDMRSLENVAMVCRGFYLFARDDELWRLSCYRLWGTSTGKVKKYGSWRTMFLERPHLQFTGCYISKTSYIRQGERSFEQYYTPWHEVSYFRYIRFFPDGKVLMMTSAEEPAQTLSLLRFPNSDLSGVMKGMYRISGSRVTGVLKRKETSDNITSRYKRNKNESKRSENTHTYHIELEINSASKRKGHKLTWISYNVNTLHRSTGAESVTDFDLKKGFNPLIFSRVKSYTSRTDAPLTL